MAPTRASSLLVGLSSLGIAILTLGPAPPAAPSEPWCLFCGTLGGVDFALNVVLFIPLGIGLRWRLGRALPAVAIGMAVTLLVELLQWRVIPGRDAALGDLVANTIGTAVGAWLASRLAAWLGGVGRQAAPRSWTAACLSAVVIAGTSVALHPVSTSYLLYVQWTLRRAGMDPFPGQRLRSVELNGTVITRFEGLTPDRLRRNDTTRVRLALDGPIPATTRRSIIVRLANSPAEGMFVGQERDALLYRTLTLGARHKFRSPLVRLDGAFRPDAEGPITADLVATPRSISLSVSDPQGQRGVAVRRTPGLGWTMVLPWDIAIGPGWCMVNTAWIAALFLPAVFFATRSRLPDESFVHPGWLPVAALAGVLAGAPVVLGMSLPGWPEWLGVATGIGMAVVAANLTRPRTPTT